MGKAISGAIALAIPVIASAHPGNPGQGIGAGLSHLFTGWDHLLAIATAGLWAAQLGGRTQRTVLLAFVGTLILGGAIGASGATWSAVEPIVAASVLTLGLLVAAAIRLPLHASFALIVIFGLVHGIAHGAEIPLTIAGLGYAVGFVVAVTSLFVMVIWIAAQVACRSASANRIAGAGVAFAGVALLCN